MHWPAFLLLGLTLAQALPDTIWGFDVGHDSSTFTQNKLFSGGWSIRHYRKNLGDWRETRRDTILLDASYRILSWTVWVDTTAGLLSFAPSDRYEITYSSPGEVIITHYGYQDPIFVPLRRYYGYGWAPGVDTLTTGWLGVLVIDHNLITGSAFWPMPFQWLKGHWGDSLRVEEFDGGVQVFIESSGYALKRRLAACDSFLVYQTSGGSRTWQGETALCYDALGRVTEYQDSFCTPIECMKVLRTWSYHSNGLPDWDSTHTWIYTPTGQLLGSVGYARTYQWDGQGRLIGATYPFQRYVLIYSSGQVLSLASRTAPSLNAFAYLGPERAVLIQASGLTYLTLYTTQGEKVWSAQGVAGDKVSLPPTLAHGVYLLRGVTAESSHHSLVYIE